MEDKLRFRPNPSLKLMDQVREFLRYHHYAYRTETSYCQRTLRYVRFFGNKTHPKDLCSQHVERFLSNLTTQGKVSASTQRQALNAIVFLYREVLDFPLDGKISPIRSKKQQRPLTVRTQEEIKRLLLMMSGTLALMSKLLYGSGLRLMECIRLRIQDVDFGQNKIFVREGKGGKDRTIILPGNVREELQTHIKSNYAISI
ncbi:MAG: phage integrase N-terminal SAM-like domain-containing protein [Candidatus Scalindua sp.]|nr:phage integrase N-terminal SAM-like domain-containing protein [Candidatus Scalindua sp.]MCR4343533.1 phage integrase N-terminal SAM-like domain-containing protein [Candidatus Scalindua sp.]